MIDFVTTVINQHLVGKDGRTAYERMKHKLHRGEVLPFGCHVILRISGKVAGGWFGTQAISGGHLIPRTSDESAVWTRAVKELPAKTTIDDLNKIYGKPWALTGVLTEKVVAPLSRP